MVMSENAYTSCLHGPLAMELHGFDRLNHSTNTIPESSGPSSFVANLPEEFIFDEAVQPLVQHERPDQYIPYGQRDKGLVHNDPSLAERASRKRRYRLASWKIGVATAPALSSIVLLINFILTLWASLRFGLDHGLETAYKGDCGTVNILSICLHVLINALSSILLSGSNYTMQCATAPTRRECDRAHLRSDWLDIGVPSIRNLRKIDRRRRIICALLALSSIPLHLLYNSGVLKTVESNSYNAVLASPDYLESGLNASGSAPDSRLRRIADAVNSFVDDPSIFVHLSPEDCIR